MKCNIVPVGKRRDGGTRFWCLNHKADATAKYGRQSKKCRYADVPPVTDEEHLSLDLSRYPGGVAIWGAAPPIYDTSNLPLARGIHIHARQVEGGDKLIDDTYRSVCITENGKDYEITELDAIYFMVSTIFEIETKYLECPFCEFPHLDKDWFCVHPHRRHLCAGCGKIFSDSELSVGNPMTRLYKDVLRLPREAPVPSSKLLDITQTDFPGGIQVWGSNPAILWTSGRHEESGIHVHVHSENDPTSLKHDETFGKVIIDGLELDPLMVRTLMAQNCLPHLKRRIVSLQCSNCEAWYFDKGHAAFTPATDRNCLNCGYPVKSKTRLKKVISNPLKQVLNTLASGSPSTRKKHSLDLIPESI